MPRRTSLKKHFPSTVWVPAVLDRGIGFDETALKEAVRNRLVVPVSSRLKTINSARSRAGIEPITQESADSLYLVPMRFPASTKGREKELRRRDEFTWQRSDWALTDQDKSYFVKGIGVPPVSLGRPEGLQLARQYDELTQLGAYFHVEAPNARFWKRGSLAVPVFYDAGWHYAEGRLRGGTNKSTIGYVVPWLGRLRNEYKLALAEGDPVAVAARNEGIRELPIPGHVAAFHPIEVPAGKVDSDHDPLSTRRFRALTSYLPKKQAEGLTQWLWTAPHPHRLVEWEISPERVNHKLVLKANGIDVVKGKLLSGGKVISPQEALDRILRRHAVASALLVHLMNNRLGHSFSDGLMSVFTDHNVGPGLFVDFDTIIKRNRVSFGGDVGGAKGRTLQAGNALVYSLAECLPGKKSYISSMLDLHFRQGKNQYPALIDGLVEEGRKYAESKRREQSKIRRLGRWLKKKFLG